MKKTFLVLMGIFLGIYAQAQTNQEWVRLAIVPEATEAANAGDVLTVEFSKNERVHLLERAEIERVYREQGLSAGNTDYLKLGQILGADGLLLLDDSAEGTNHFLNVRLIAVKPGVVLVAERFPWPLANIASWASSLNKHLEGLLPKLGVLKKDALPISVVNLRSAVGSAAGADTERQLKLLTIQRLSQEPQLFVLERQNMQSLSEEKALKADELAFWNGSYLLDGVIDQNGFSPNFVTINARLTPPNGGEPMAFVVSGSRTNLAEVVNRLVEKVTTLLQLHATAPAWQSADEAKKYFDEANWALGWGVYKEAQAAADSAWALGKQDLPCAIVRVRAYLMEVEASTISFQQGEDTLSPGADANGKLLGPLPSGADVQKEINMLSAQHPLMGAFEVNDVGGMKSINYAFADRLPNPENIGRAIHVLELYNEFSRDSPEGETKLLTRGKGWNDWHDSDWYRLGLDCLVGASKVLQDFYFAPTLQKDSAENLAELRERARAVAQLIFQSPTIHDSYFVDNRVATYDELSQTVGNDGGRNPNIFDCMVNWGCFWQESPEDCVMLYQQLMKSPVFSYIHVAFWNRDVIQPRLIAWNKEDKQRIPHVWKDFTTKLNQSSNVLWQLEARAIAMADANNEARLGMAFTNFFTDLFANQDRLVANTVDVLYLNWGADALVGAKTSSGLSSKFKDALSLQFYKDYRPKLEAMHQEYRSKTVPAAEVANAFEKQKSYLRENRRFDFFEFNKVFEHKSYTLAQAREILPLIIAFKSNLLAQAESAESPQNFKLNSNAHSVEFFLQRPVEQILHPTPAPAVQQKIMRVATVPAAQPVMPLLQPAEALPMTNIILVHKLLEIPFESFPGSEGGKATITAHHWQEEKLVLDIKYNTQVSKFDEKGNWKGTENIDFPAIATLDPATEHWQVIRCPDTDYANQNYFYHHTVLLHGELFTSNCGRVMKYDTDNKVWKTLELPDLGNCELFAVNDALYAANHNLIVEIMDGGARTRILASNRRQPPTSMLDMENLGTPTLFAGPKHSLWVATSDKFYSWSGSDWSVEGAAPRTPLPPIISEDGILFRADGWDAPAAIWILPTSSGQVDFCLGQNQTSGIGPMNAHPHASSAPLWKQPPELNLQNLPAATHGSELLLLVGHAKEQDVINEQQHEVTAMKILPRDGYHAALYCFNSNFPAPMKVFLRFENHEGVAPPVLPDQNSGASMGPGPPPGWMLFGDRELFLGRETTDLIGEGDYYFPKAGVWIVSGRQIDSEVARQKTLQEEALAGSAADAHRAMAALLEKYDTNHDGIIDGQEKEAALADGNFIAFELQKIDANQNGLLDADELKYFDANTNRMLDQNELAGVEIAQHLLADQLLRKFDANGDGYLNWNETQNLMRSGLGAQLGVIFFPDNNHDGKIDVNEVQSLCEKITLRGVARQGQPGMFFPGLMHPSMNSSSDTTRLLKISVDRLWQTGNTNRSPARPTFMPPVMLHPGQLR
jgi:hypothetical protein